MKRKWVNCAQKQSGKVRRNAFFGKSGCCAVNLCVGAGAPLAPSEERLHFGKRGLARPRDLEARLRERERAVAAYTKV